MNRKLIIFILFFFNYSLAMSNDGFAECSETVNSISPTYVKLYQEWVVFHKLLDENTKKSNEQYNKIAKINLAIQDALTVLIDEKKLDARTTSLYYGIINIFNIEVNLMAKADSEKNEQKTILQVKRELIKKCINLYILGKVE